MKLRDKSIKDIHQDNDLKLQLMNNVVEETSSKNKIRATMEIIAKTLSGTLGPYGSTTIIQSRDGRHFASKDGYDLMSRINFVDEVARTILDIIRQVSSNQVLTVGDGSTSTVIVANALYNTLTSKESKEFFSRIASKDVVDILNDILTYIENNIDDYTKPVSEDLRELSQVATISANNDPKTGEFMMNVYRRIGQDGFITTDINSKQDEDSFEIKSGVEWDRGYIDSVFANPSLTNRSEETKKIVYEEPRIVIVKGYLTYDHLVPVIIPLLQEANKQPDSKTLFILNNFDEDVRSFFKHNRTQHLDPRNNVYETTFAVVDISTITEHSRNMMSDIATLAGCDIFDVDVIPFELASKHADAYVGSIARATITEKTTQLLMLDHDKMDEDQLERVKDKIEYFKDALIDLKNEGKEDNDLQVYEFKKRLSRFTDSTAIIHVGGRTLNERTTRERLFEDAIFACKSAMRSGVIPGGNITVPKILHKDGLKITEILKEKYNYLPIEDKDEFFNGFISMLKEAFLESYKTVLQNSYLDDNIIKYILNQCIEDDVFYNLKTHKFENIDETSVINSKDTDVNIARSCVSIIGILSTSNQTVTLNLDNTASII